MKRVSVESAICISIKYHTYGVKRFLDHPVFICGCSPTKDATIWQEAARRVVEWLLRFTFIRE